MRSGRHRTLNTSRGNEIVHCLPCCSPADFAATNSPSCPSVTLQQREGHWAIVDLRGKAGHVRTIPVPDWVYRLLNDWTTAAGIATGSLFRRVSSAGGVRGDAVTEKLVWHVVKEFAAKIGVSKLAPHDLRRSCARLCRSAGGELEQIQFLPGHVSVQTTERYLGCTQRISSVDNHRIGRVAYDPPLNE